MADSVLQQLLDATPAPQRPSVLAELFGGDPFEAAAMRTSRAVRPEGGGRKQEGRITKTIERTPQMLGELLAGIFGLPGRITEAAAGLQETGEYNPQPATELMSMMLPLPVAPRGTVGSGMPSRLFAEAAEAGKARALQRRNEGAGGTNKMLPTQRDVDRLRGGAPEGGQLVAEKAKADWGWQRRDAIEDYLRAVYPERYEGFELGSGGRRLESVAAPAVASAERGYFDVTPSRLAEVPAQPQWQLERWQPKDIPIEALRVAGRENVDRINKIVQKGMKMPGGLCAASVHSWRD